jgi:hypothetical protein
MAKTYEPIATTTLGTAAASITFSSIPATYTDLRLVVMCKPTGDSTAYVQFNSDTGSNYSRVNLRGNGSSAASSQNANQSNGVGIQTSSATGTNPVLWTLDVFSYAGSTYKTTLASASNDQNGSGNLELTVGLWRNTAAITSLKLQTTIDNYDTGTTATLYGILKA